MRKASPEPNFLGGGAQPIQSLGLLGHLRVFSVTYLFELPPLRDKNNLIPSKMKSYFDHPVQWHTASASSYVPMDYAERALLAQLTEPNWPSGLYASTQLPGASESYENTDGSDGGRDNFEHLLQAPLVSSQYRIDVLRSLLQEREKLSRRLLSKLGSHRCQLEQQLDVTMYGGCLGALVLGSLFYIGTAGPETFVVSGRQMNKAHTKIIRDLGLLENSEKIQYFYSDALFDIRKGMYFVTDKKLVLYSEDWEDPRLVAPFAEIIDAQGEFNESFLDDSYVSITMDNGDEWTFPVSSERGKDKDFYEYLTARIGKPVEQGAPADAVKPHR